MSSRFVIGGSPGSSGGKRTLSRFVSLSWRPPVDQRPSFGMSASAASSSAVALVGFPDAGDLLDAGADLADGAAGLADARSPLDVVGGRGARAGAAAAFFAGVEPAERPLADGGLLDALAAGFLAEPGLAAAALRFPPSAAGASSVASAAAAASLVETGRSRFTAFGSWPSSMPLNDVWRTSPSRVQPPSSALITSSGRTQMTFRSSPFRSGAGSNGGFSVTIASSRFLSSVRVRELKPDPTLPANRSLSPS